MVRLSIRHLTVLAVAVGWLATSVAAAEGATIDMKGGSFTDPWVIAPLADNTVLYANKYATSTIKIGRYGPNGSFPSVLPVQLAGLEFGPAPALIGLPDGTVWGPGSSSSSPIVRVDALGRVTKLTALSSGGIPDSWARAADGTLWFTEQSEMSGIPPPSQIGRLDPVAGSVTEFAGLSTGGIPASSMVTGPDGNMWFLEAGSNQVGRITPEGVLTEFPLPPTAQLRTGWDRGRSMTAGPGGDLYLVVEGGIARMTQAGIVTAVYDGGFADFAPNAVAYGLDGNLWVAECGGTPSGALSSVTRMSPWGVMTRSVPGSFPRGACPTAIVSASDGTPWFYEWNTGRIGRMVFDAPLAKTLDPSEVSDGGARVVGSGSPRGAATSVRFEFGTSVDYGRVTDAQEIGDGDESVAVSARLSGLSSSTTYHYRLVATSPVGTAVGVDHTFTTSDAPPPPPPPAPVDGDRDGYPVTIDCNDADAGVHPGAVDRPVNGVDEDCSGKDAAYQRFAPHTDADWKTTGRKVTFTRLAIDDMPAGSSLALTCRGPGCKVRGYSAKIARPARRLDVAGRLKWARLGKGARIELRLSRPGFITTIVRWSIDPKPHVTIRCQAPGAKSPTACQLK